MIRALLNPYCGKLARLPFYSQLFALQHTQSSLTGTVNETELYSVTIPGGTMGANGKIRITVTWTATNNANNKTLKIKFGGTLFNTTVITTQACYSTVIEIANRNAQNSQVRSLNGVFGGSLSSLVTASIDTSADCTLQITGTLANAADTMAIEAVGVEVLK